MSLIRMTSGDDLACTYTIKDQNNAIVDLTGGSVSWRALVSGTSTALITKTTGGGGVVLSDPTNGQCVVSIVPPDTAGLLGTYTIDGEFTDVNSDVYTFDDGGLVIT